MNQAGGGGCFTRVMPGVSSDRKIHRRAGLLLMLPLELGLQLWVTNPAQLGAFGDSDKHKKQHLSLSSICSGVCGDKHSRWADPQRNSPVSTTTKGSSAAPLSPASPGSHLCGTWISLWNAPAASHGSCCSATVMHGTGSPENPQKAFQHLRK